MNTQKFCYCCGTDLTHVSFFVKEGRVYCDPKYKKECSEMHEQIKRVQMRGEAQRRQRPMIEWR